MKKKFIFTEETSFTHVLDKMHDSVTEHIVQDDETKKLYHHVVSYGSWFKVSYSSIFMSHLLKKIGVTGFGLGHSADKCDIKLPCYPYHRPERKSVVELPEFVKLEDVYFGSTKTEKCEEYKQTFVGKEFEKQYSQGFRVISTGEDLLPYLLDCSVFKYGEAKVGDKVYPLQCILYGATWHEEEDLLKLADTTDVFEREDVREILEKFTQIDIEKSVKAFEEELQTEMPELKKELIRRQKVIKSCLLTHKTEEQTLK